MTETTLGWPIPPKPELFTPESAPAGVEVKFVTFAGTRPKMRNGGKARAALVHTNGASGEGTVTSAWNWSHARPGKNTLPHYQIDRKHDGVWARKMLATNLRGIGNSTVDEYENQDLTTPDDDFDISWHSIVIETADLGYPTPGEACGFQLDQGECVATVLAFESIVSDDLPLDYPDHWYGDGCMAHTDPWGYPYTTLYPGKVCPGAAKKRELRSWILPRAREIRTAWLGHPVVINPPSFEEDDMQEIITKWAGESALIVVSAPDGGTFNRQWRGINDQDAAALIAAGVAKDGRAGSLPANLKGGLAPEKLGPFQYRRVG